MSLPDEEPEEEADEVELAECSTWCDCGRLVASASELPGLTELAELLLLLLDEEEVDEVE